MLKTEKVLQFWDKKFSTRVARVELIIDGTLVVVSLTSLFALARHGSSQLRQLSLGGRVIVTPRVKRRRDEQARLRAQVTSFQSTVRRQDHDHAVQVLKQHKVSKVVSRVSKVSIVLTSS